MTKNVVDAHALVWFLENNPKLGNNAKTILSDPHSSLIVPAIALAEACWVVQAGRTKIANPQDVIDAVAHDPRYQVAPLDLDVIQRTLALTAVGEMHDRQIVATALRLIDAGEATVLLTKDANITASGLVPVLW